jgi:hypothetical protein
VIKFIGIVSISHAAARRTFKRGLDTYIQVPLISESSGDLPIYCGSDSTIYIR